MDGPKLPFISDARTCKDVEMLNIADTPPSALVKSPAADRVSAGSERPEVFTLWVIVLMAMRNEENYVGKGKSERAFMVKSFSFVAQFCSNQIGRS